MKLIREARMGAPKSFKTGAVVGTYPKPLLYLGFGQGGIDVIPNRAKLDQLKAAPNGLIVPDVAYEDIRFLKPGCELATVSRQADQAPVTAIQYSDDSIASILLDYKPTANATPMVNFGNDYNGALVNKPTLPWKTVVLDDATGFSDAVLGNIAAVSPNSMADARQWASMASGMLRKTILSMTCLPCHVVVLLHVYLDKNELTGAIRELPNVYGQVLRTDFFGLFSQVFYSTIQNGRPVVWPSARYPVEGIGCRWPIGLPNEVQPDFNSIYGKEL